MLYNNLWLKSTYVLLDAHCVSDLDRQRLKCVVGCRCGQLPTRNQSLKISSLKFGWVLSLVIYCRLVSRYNKPSS